MSWLPAAAVVMVAVCVVACRETPELPPELPAALEAACRQYRVPAMAGALVTPERIEVAVSGVRKQGGQEEVTEQDLWHLGSNTKAMTATLAAILETEGQLSLDEKAAAVYDFELHPDLLEITLRDLLQHRAGLQAFTASEEFDAVDRQIDFTATPAKQRLAFARHVLSSEPAGAVGDYIYSNAGYGIAGSLIERKAGRDWELLLREKLCGPLGIGLRVGWPATADDPDQPLGHGWAPFGLEVFEVGNEYRLDASIAPAGDVSLSVGDYARFVQLHLRGLLDQATPGADGKPILTSAAILALHEPVGDYSCGWVETGFEGLAASGHEGCTGTFYAVAIIVPELGRAAVALGNRGDNRGGAACQAVTQALLRGNSKE